MSRVPSRKPPITSFYEWVVLPENSLSFGRYRLDVTLGFRMEAMDLVVWG